MSNIPCPLQHNAIRFSEKAALVWGYRQISWAQLDGYVAHTAKHLKSIGLNESDRIAVLSENNIDFIVLFLACLRIGIIFCPLNTRLSSNQINQQLAQLSVKRFFVSVDQVSKFQDLSESFILLDELITYDFRSEFFADQKKFEIHLDTPATIMFSSGSSANPKAIVHSYGNHYYNAKGSNEVAALDQNSAWVLSLPLFHVAGIGVVFRSLLSGAAIVVENTEVILKRDVTHISLVPTQLQRMLQDTKTVEALKKLNVILLGGSYVSDALKQKIVEHNLPVYLTYGLTEMASQVATGRMDESIKVLPYRQLEIKESEIFVSGETLALGVWQQASIKPLTEDGWYATGDLGAMDGDSLEVKGRKDLMFISGGENIQPEQIEKVILNVKGICNAVVVPKEDSEFGKRPVCFIDADAVDVDALKQYLVNHLAKYEVPVSFYKWPEGQEGMKVKRSVFTDLVAQDSCASY